MHTSPLRMHVVLVRGFTRSFEADAPAVGVVGAHQACSAVCCLSAIQDTLHEPPKAVVNMKRAVNTGMGCSLMFYLAVSITGYMALGDKVPGDILTGFSEPAGVVAASNVMVLLHMLPAYQV
jgi:amino acid permease